MSDQATTEQQQQQQRMWLDHLNKHNMDRECLAYELDVSYSSACRVVRGEPLGSRVQAAVAAYWERYADWEGTPVPGGPPLVPKEDPPQQTPVFGAYLVAAAAVSAVTAAAMHLILGAIR